MKLKLFNLFAVLLIITTTTAASALFMACCCDQAPDPYTNSCVADGMGGVECKKECKTGYTGYDDPDGTNEDPICCKGAKDHTGTLNDTCCDKAGGGVRIVNGVKKCCRQSPQGS